MKKSIDSSGGHEIDIAPLVRKAMKNDARAAAELWRILATNIDDCNYDEINKWTNFVAARIVDMVLDPSVQRNRVPDGALIAIGLSGVRGENELQRWIEFHDEAIIGFTALDPVPESSERAKTVALAKYVIEMGMVGPTSKLTDIVKRIERYRKEKK